jgi:hypothetical protein
MKTELNPIDLAGMIMEADYFLTEFSDTLSDMPQKEKIKYIKQLILDMMDWTEQSPEEKLWCALYDKLEELEVKEKL